VKSLIVALVLLCSTASYRTARSQWRNQTKCLGHAPEHNVGRRIKYRGVF